MSRDRPTACVIGSGFGGLAVAIRLQASGFRTTLFEARDQAGGRAYVYRDKGFTFDAGPTVITAPHALRELFEITGRSMDDYVELLPVEPFYRLMWEDGDVFDYGSSTEHFLEQIAAKSPADREGYLRFLAYSKRVFAKGYEELAATPFLRFTDMVRVAPDLMRLRADRSVYGAVSHFVKNEHLRQALSFHSLLVGGNPFDTSSIYTLIHYLEKKWGVTFPRGGTGALVQALVRLFREVGGEVRLGCPVERIEPREAAGGSEEGRGAGHWITSRLGARERFDIVVSNADVHHTYGKLLASDARAAVTRQKLERLDWSMSLFVLYFGVDRVYENVAHHTVLFGGRYRELLRDIFDGPSLPDDFSLYLHAPTVTDPSLAPPGCTSFYVLSPVPHLGKAAIDWSTVAPAYADKILASLERLLPDVRKHVVTHRWFTPSDFESQLMAYQGSAFSVAPTLVQSAWFRPHNRDPKIPGLYIVGAGTHPGAGLPGVINSAKATFQIIEKDFAA
jgi:phytoene desaturase